MLLKHRHKCSVHVIWILIRKSRSIDLIKCILIKECTQLGLVSCKKKIRNVLKSDWDERSGWLIGLCHTAVVKSKYIEAQSCIFLKNLFSTTEMANKKKGWNYVISDKISYFFWNRALLSTY